MGVTIRIEDITPEVAARWLEQNTTNRVLDQATVDRYARDMKAGKWHFTGDPLQFGKSGRLLNGQHRLWACITADTVFRTSVVRGIENEIQVMDVLDTGKRRTLGNALQIHGEKDANNLAAAIAMVWRYERDRFRSGQFPTHEEGIEWLLDNPDIREAVLVGRRAHHGMRINVTSAAAAFYINSRVDAQAAEEFWEKFSTGAELAAGDPILAFRRWMMSAVAKRERPTSQTYFVYAMKTMQLWRDGKKARLLIVRDADPIPEPWSS